MMAHRIQGASAAEISRSIEGEIRRGALPPGGRLPTVRALAARLAVSPTTVAAAYRGLRNRGLLVGRGRRGTAVSERPPIAVRPAAPVPRGVRDLAVGNPDPELLPDLGPALAAVDPEPVLYGDELGDPELLRIAARSFRADRIPADSLSVVAGALDGIERVLLAHLAPGDRVAVEDPGFSGVLHLLAALGLTAVPMAIDDAGPLPAALARALQGGVGAAIVTPRAQNPLGAALDAGRVRALRRVLRSHPDVVVIEDDHAGAVAGAPARSLCHPGRANWAHVRSVCKALGPDLRLAVVAADAGTTARIEGRQQLGIRWVSRLLQQVVVHQWKSRSAAAVLRSAERAYTRRRRALIDALASRGIGSHGRSGLNVWVPVPDEGEACAALLDCGWAVAPGRRFRQQTPPAIRITSAALGPEDAARFAADLARTLAPGRRTLSA